MRIAKETQVLALVIGAQLASAAAVFATPPDYLLLKRCRSTMDERAPCAAAMRCESSRLDHLIRIGYHGRSCRKAARSC